MEFSQEQFEIEAAQLAKGRREEIKCKLDTVSLEFEAEITFLAKLIEGWRQSDALSSARQTVAYVILLNQIPSAVLAETVIRAILEEHLTVDAGSPITYQAVVVSRLINGRLKSLLPQEELHVPLQHKLYPIDLLVSRTVMHLPNMFMHHKQRGLNVEDTILLTETAQERLGMINIHHLITDVPMFCKPQDWTSVFDGGFLTKELQRANPLVGSKAHDYKELRKIDQSLQENPGILEAVNKMQAVKYRVDKRFGYFQDVIDKVRKATLNEKKQELAAIDGEIEKLLEIVEAEQALEKAGQALTIRETSNS